VREAQKKKLGKKKHAVRKREGRGLRVHTAPKVLFEKSTFENRKALAACAAFAAQAYLFDVIAVARLTAAFAAQACFCVSPRLRTFHVKHSKNPRNSQENQKKLLATPCISRARVL
jgi:hypothetical protein